MMKGGPPNRSSWGARWMLGRLVFLSLVCAARPTSICGHTPSMRPSVHLFAFLLGAAHAAVDQAGDCAVLGIHTDWPDNFAILLLDSMASGEYFMVTENAVESDGSLRGVNGTILAMENAPATGVYNIGCGVARTFNDMVDALNVSLGTKLDPEYFPCPFIDSYQAFTQADLTKSEKDLGYKPQFTLEQGVDAYMKWLHPARTTGSVPTP